MIVQLGIEGGGMRRTERDRVITEYVQLLTAIATRHVVARGINRKRVKRH